MGIGEPNSADGTGSSPSVEDARLAGLPQVGDVIAEKYRVDKVLGKGGMGVVVAVTHLGLSEPYAMKFLLPDAMSSPEAVTRFLREAKSAVRLKSEHVARVSDIGTLPNGCPYILMEHLSGTDLSAYVKARGALTERETIDLVLQACVGVAEAHALGIVHRDLKPSNLFMTTRLDGSILVKVLDFGISKALGDHMLDEPTLTKTNAMVGSPAYMSPEQLRNPKAADVRADLWSIGVILYRLLTGKLPFKADTWSGIVSSVTADPPPSLRIVRPELSGALEAAVLRCLEKDITRRFQNVGELAAALAPFASEGTRVYVERILRLGNRTRAPGENTPTTFPGLEDISPNSGSPKSGAPRSVNPTAKPWVAETVVEGPPRRSKAVWFVTAAAVVAVAAGAYALRAASSDRSTAANAANAAPVAPAVANPVPETKPVTEASATASATTGAAPAAPAAPSTPAARPISSAPSVNAPLPRRPQRAAPARTPPTTPQPQPQPQPPPTMTTTKVAEPSAAPPTAPRHGGDTIDPTAESH